MDIPSLFIIPSAVSSGKVHSVFPNSTDADFDFNRDSDATRVNSEGLIERVGYYGSELITNGDFSNGYVGWSLSGNPSNYSVEVVDYAGRTNALHFTTTAANEGVNQNVLQSSTAYYVRFDLKVISGSVYVGKSTAKATNGNLSPSEWTTYNVNWTSGDTYFRIYSATAGAEFYVDNVSVKEITGDRARLNYEIEGGLVNTKPSLLLEPQSTNLVTYSEDFSQSYWSKNKVTVTPNAIISPTGELNASLIQETSYTSSTNSIDLENAISLSAGTYTLSFYVKNNKGRYLGISFGSSSERVRTNFDFNTNTFKALNLSGTTTGSASFTTLGDFYRISVTATFPSTVPVKSTITPLATDTYPFFALQDSDNRSFYMWGVQWEELSYPTSYIPTNGITQTRAAETCNGAGTSSILPSEEGILYAEIAALESPTTSALDISISNGATTNYVRLEYYTDGKIYGTIYDGSFAAGSTTVTQTNFNKIAVFWRSSGSKFALNGAITSFTGKTFSANTFNTLQFAAGNGTSAPYYGKIRDIRVYNTKEMTDSEVDILLTKITS